MQNLTRCPACDGNTSAAKAVRAFHSKRGDVSIETQLVECSCGHVFTNPQPSWEELAPFYASDYHVFADAQMDAAGIDKLVKNTPQNDGRFNHVKVIPGARYLDVGCGLGTMVAAMSHLGMKAEGVEPSSVAAKKSRAAGLKIFSGSLEQAKFPSGTFDAITMLHVLEHTPNPIETLRECRRVLKPDGELIVSVPNYDSLVRALVRSSWNGFSQPHHLHHFRVGSIRAAADRAGLCIADQQTESVPIFVESELIHWIKLRLCVPARLMLATRIAWPIAAYLSRIGNNTGRGEAIIARMGISI